jgi:hypothetical protein
MAVMLRSLDIPSRVVSGYAQGHYDGARDAYVVLLQDAHTWVEVFFPNYGWVEFEPTAAQPVILRPAEPEDIDLPLQNPNQELDVPSPADQLDRLAALDEGALADSGSGPTSLWARLVPTKPSSWIFGGLVLLTLASITVWTMRNRRTARLSSVGSIYNNMLRLASWAGARTHITQTPLEHASALGRVVPEGKRPAQRIADLYAYERYGHQAPDDHEQATANQAWRELRPRLVRKTILRTVLRRGPR